MADRAAEIHDLAADLAEYDAVADAWLAKSFTDRLLVVEVRAGAVLPADAAALVREHGLAGYNEVHDVGVEAPAFAGDLSRGDRYRFVDLETRGELQSYVVE